MEKNELSSQKREKILQKLRKLMNLKESATELGNEGEAQAAAAGITRLLMEYNLSEADIPEQEKVDNPVIAEEIPYKAEENDGVWFSALVGLVCQYNMCRHLIVRSSRSGGRLKRSKFRLVGRKKNVEIAQYLISFLSRQFVSIGNRKYPIFVREYERMNPPTLHKFLRSFLYGCVMGLSMKFEEERRGLENDETNVTALVVTMQHEIDDFLQGLEIGKVRNHRVSFDSCCMKQGIDVGHNIEITKGVHSTRTNEQKVLF